MVETIDLRKFCLYCKGELTEKEIEVHAMCKSIVETYQNEFPKQFMEKILTDLRKEYDIELAHYITQIESLKCSYYELKQNHELLIKRYKKERKEILKNEKDSFGFSALDFNFKLMTESVMYNYGGNYVGYRDMYRSCCGCNKKVEMGEYFTSQKKDSNKYKYVHLQCFDSYLKKIRIRLLIMEE